MTTSQRKRNGHQCNGNAKAETAETSLGMPPDMQVRYCLLKQKLCGFKGSQPDKEKSLGFRGLLLLRQHSIEARRSRVWMHRTDHFQLPGCRFIPIFKPHFQLVISFIELYFPPVPLDETLQGQLQPSMAIPQLLTFLSHLLATIAVVLLLLGAARSSPYMLLPHMLMQVK